MNTRLPAAVRATAAALAVFTTVAVLNGTLSAAEPKRSELIAQSTARLVAEAAAARRATLVAQASAGQRER
jgi:nucleoside permease NupC